MKQHGGHELVEDARKAFENKEYEDALEKLLSVEQGHISIDTNKLLAELFLNKDQNLHILKKLLQVLTKQNVHLYANRPKEIKYISHELLYWNIMVLASWNAQPSLTDLVGNQALFFYKAFKPSTSLKIISEKMKVHLAQNRLASCFALYEKFQKVYDHNRKMSAENQRYKSLINLLFTRALTKLSMIEEAQSMYMMKFGQNEKEAFFYTEEKNSRKEVYSSSDDMISFLQAEIQLMSRNYEKCVGLLGPYLNEKLSCNRAFAENNLAIVLALNQKHTAAQKIFFIAAQNLYKIISQQKRSSPQATASHQKMKQNMILAYILIRDKKQTCTHSTLEYDQKHYTQMKAIQDFHSYKQYYRKGESCLNFYHSLLQKSCRKVPYDQIHDNYGTVYFKPNVPYFQFKGNKNKNPTYSMGKVSNRRYLLPEHSIQPEEEELMDKDINRKKFEKQATSLKLRQILDNASQYFKKSLMFLQSQKKVVVQMDGIQIGKILTQKLFHEHTKFQASILCLLAYVQLCRNNWSCVLGYSRQFEENKYNQKQSENYYCVLSYKMEALCELDRSDEAYLCAHQILNFQPSKSSKTQSQDGSNLWEAQWTQQVNFLYNIAVLHSRQNRIAESHSAIQKLLQQMNKIPNHPRADMPLPLIDLLIHYNLRINNVVSALQLIKRRRILTEATPNKQVFSITK